MGDSATIIRTDRFSVEWGDGDSSPPPGLDFACALFHDLKCGGAKSNIDTVEHDYWEHSNWFFWITWENIRYSFRIECGFQECVPAIWLVDITKSIGFWRIVLGRGKKRYEIPRSFLTTVGEALERIAGVSQVDWIESDVAINQIYG